ncbi:MAG: hypothetical protein Q9160_001473 [Pyrenula sp. 1 TL-2023]
MASSSSGSKSNRESPVPSVNSATSADTSVPPPTAAISDKAGNDDSSKLRTFVGILRKFIGVADIAAVRFSLPSQLLEPIPNLDRPETFISIGKSDNEIGRTLEVLRFWFTKDLKYVKGKPCKPYNSTLGEFFRCNWDINDDAPSVSPGKSTTAEEDSKTTQKPVRVSFLTEQTSHHPPVSAFYVDCPERGLAARGFDQISAKFTGTSVRVVPGAHNLGIFITLKNRDNEEYQLTHPAAHLGGFLRGSLSVSVADTCFITCKKTRIKVILHYLEEAWLGRAQNRVQGVLYRYNPDKDKITRIKDVPEKDILGRVEGCWQEKITYTVAGSDEPPQTLIDLTPLFPVPKSAPPEEEQLPNESRKLWSKVTDAILSKQWGQATKEKQDLEERQREKTAERKAQSVEWKPRFFTAATDPIGKPDLTDEGEKALKGLQDGNFKLAENAETST